jgi:hypothetical protein
MWLANTLGTMLIRPLFGLLGQKRISIGDVRFYSLMHMTILNPAPVICQKENSSAYPQGRSSL